MCVRDLEFTHSTLNQPLRVDSLQRNDDEGGSSNFLSLFVLMKMNTDPKLEEKCTSKRTQQTHTDKVTWKTVAGKHFTRRDRAAE